MRARVALLLVSVVVVGTVRLAFPPGPPALPLIQFAQGITYWPYGGEPAFILREGAVLTGFLARSTAPGRERLQFCPAERAFVAPEDTSLWDARGRYVAGPAPRDLDRVAVRVDPITDYVTVDASTVTRAAGRSEDGSVSGEAGEAYQLYRAGEPNAGFCLNPQPGL